MAIPFMNFMMNNPSNGISIDPYYGYVELLLNGESGISNDSSSRQTTLVNSGSSLVAGKFGSYAYDLTTPAKYLTMDNNDFYFGTEDFTVECWLYFQSSLASAYGHIFDSGGQGLALAFGGSVQNILFYSSVANTDNVGFAHGMTDNTWNHIAWVRNGTTLKVYINGVAGSRVWTGKSGSFSPAGGYLSAALGGYTGNLGSTYTPGGYIDDFRVTKGVARYTTDFSPPGQLPTTGSLVGTTGINFADAAIPRIKIGTTAPGGGSTTDDYYGPNGWNLDMTVNANYRAVGALVTNGSETNTINRPSKNVAYGSTFSGGGSAGSPFNIVIDLGQHRTINNARYYQMFSDGKTTHTALDYSTTLQSRTGGGWTQLHDYSLLDNSNTSTGISVSFNPTVARYLRLRLYNDARYDSASYTELYNFKLFYV